GTTYFRCGNSKEIGWGNLPNRRDTPLRGGWDNTAHIILFGPGRLD
ncbi:16907_t:CDS:2, partial [Racocetra persica]